MGVYCPACGALILCFSLVANWITNLLEWTERGLIIGRDQTVGAVHSCA